MLTLKKERTIEKNVGQPGNSIMILNMLSMTKS